MHRYMIAFGATSWSQAMEQLLTEKDEGQQLYADSAYTGEDQETCKGRPPVGGRLCGKQHAWLHCTHYWDCKSPVK